MDSAISLIGVASCKQTQHFEFPCGQTVGQVDGKIAQREFLSYFRAEIFLPAATAWMASTRTFGALALVT